MATTDDQLKPPTAGWRRYLAQFAWFAGIWAASVMALGLVSLLLRSWLK